MPNDAKRVDSRDDLLATISPKLISPGAEPKPRIGIDMEALAKAERNAENTEEDDIMRRLDAPVLVVFERGVRVLEAREQRGVRRVVVRRGEEDASWVREERRR